MVTPYMLPAYSEEELCAFEQLNGCTIPLALRAHLKYSKTLPRAGEHYFVDLYEHFALTQEPFDILRETDDKVVLAANHHFAAQSTTQLPAGTFRLLSGDEVDCICIDRNEYWFLVALNAQPTGMRFIEPRDDGGKWLKIADHGNGEEDHICLQNGEIEFRDYYANTHQWYSDRLPSFALYMRRALGEEYEAGYDGF